MGRYQEAGMVATDGLGTPMVVPTPDLPGDADAITAIPFGQTVALADRLGFDVDAGNAQVDLIPPPVPIPPGGVLVAARYLHSLPAGVRAAVANVAIGIGAPGVATWVHGLGGVPDFVSAIPDSQIAGNDWAVTLIDGTQIDFANWDAVNPQAINVFACRLHSIDTPLETSGPFDVVLAGPAPVVQPHGLGRVPDYLGVFPYAPGLVQPAGMAVLDVVPDAVNVTLGGNFAAAALTARCYFQATHSIQE